MLHARLIRHPMTPCPAVAGIDVRVSMSVEGELILTYTLSGDVTRLQIPAPAVPARKDELWRRTCFEAFVMTGQGPGYREFNFAPSGAWAAYRFHRYRDVAPLEPAPDPAIVCRICDAAIELEASLPRLALPAGLRLRLGLAAVVEDQGGKLSYWALRHPAGKPDFHHADAFAVALVDHGDGHATTP